MMDVAMGLILMIAMAIAMTRQGCHYKKSD